MEQIIPMLLSIHPAVPGVLAALGSLVIFGQMYVAMTPTQDDDAWFAKLESSPVIGPVLRMLKSFAPIQRKDPGQK